MCKGSSSAHNSQEVEPTQTHNHDERTNTVTAIQWVLSLPAIKKQSTDTDVSPRSDEPQDHRSARRQMPRSTVSESTYLKRPDSEKPQRQQQTGGCQGLGGGGEGGTGA